jgi:transcriptional regulator GlxA family with amidase domain
MEAAALALLCFVRKYLPDTGMTLPNSLADIHVYTGLKHRLDDWLEAFFTAMTAEAAVPTRIGISDKRIQHTLRLLDSWPLEVPLDRERVAHEAGITVPHLTRLFSAYLQHTPSRYFDSRRIAHARRSLSDSEITIKVIASELGFHSEAHFSHWFKQHAGTCPRSFRQTHVGHD